MSTIRLIVGLGNPGPEYEQTRHNLGFKVADLLEKRRGSSWKIWKNLAEVSPGEVFILKPQVYMNNSGTAVREFIKYQNILPAEIIVVIDDFSIPLGKLRLRKSGSAGGHNGLDSIIAHLATPEFPRLRLGIGHIPLNTNPADFVLSKFLPEQKDIVESMIAKAADVVETVLKEGIEKSIEYDHNRP